jgi:hypothetical protein
MGGFFEPFLLVTGEKRGDNLVMAECEFFHTYGSRNILCNVTVFVQRLCCVFALPLEL